MTAHKLCVRRRLRRWLLTERYSVVDLVAIFCIGSLIETLYHAVIS